MISPRALATSLAVGALLCAGCSPDPFDDGTGGTGSVVNPQPNTSGGGSPPASGSGSGSGSAAQNPPQPANDLTPPHAGEPCPSGSCAPGAVCIGGMCLRMCAASVPSCNDFVKACGPEEVCLPATSFTDACFPASAPTGGRCGDNGAICRAGNLCVKMGDGQPARCLKLCKYNCAADQCVRTDSGCNVCLPR